MKIERRQLIKQLPAETAVNVLLACWDYLETGEIPETLQPMEKNCFQCVLSGHGRSMDAI